jgi:hypothetical protein
MIAQAVSKPTYTNDSYKWDEDVITHSVCVCVCVCVWARARASETYKYINV